MRKSFIVLGGLILPFLCTSLFSQKNNEQISGGELSEVEVIGSRTPTTYQQNTRIVSIISKEQIKELPVQSVVDLLDYVAGVDLRQRGPMGIQADVSIRGGSFDQVMILLNGINVTDPQTGHLSMNLPIDLNSIERIEILEGPGARVYGPNAFSGAINFVTGTSNNNQIKTNALTGENGLISCGAGITYNSKHLKTFITANGTKSDGYVDNTDFKSGNIFYQGKLNLGNEMLDWQAGYLDKSFGAFAFYTPKYPNQYEQNRTLFTSIKYSSAGKLKLSPSIYWRRNHDRFELFRDHPASWYTTHNYHMTDVFGSSVNGAIHWIGGTTSIGGEVRGESIFSNNLGDLLTTPIDVPGEDNAQFTRSYNRINSSFFAEHTFTYQSLTISAGILANHNTGLDYKFRFFPGIDAAYWINDHLKVIAGYNHSLRMPTFTDLFYNTSTAIGNRNLKPEEVKSVESGLRWNATGIESRISGFYKHSTQLIDWGRTSSTEKYQSLNISDMNSHGFECFILIRPADYLKSLDVIQHFSVDYLYLSQDKKADSNYDSRYVMDYLKHKLVINLKHKIAGPVTASWNASWLDRMGTYTNADNQTLSYEPYWLIDFRVNLAIHNANIFAEASNLLDQSYEDIGNVPQPGRWIKGGINYKFNWN